MDYVVSETCIKKLDRDTRIEVHESSMIRFRIIDAFLQKNGNKAAAGWVRNENMIIETVMKIGVKTYSVAGIVDVVDVWVGIVEFHAIEPEPYVLVFGNEAGVVARPICRAVPKAKETSMML